ncbi:MAG: stage V sporulation protein AC [Acutalibacteraceae bacterium]
MKVSPNEFSKMADKASPKSKIFKNCLGAFLVGGFISVLGEFLIVTYQNMGLEIKDARALTSVSLVFLAALVTALGLYDNLAKFAGAGSIVPITGFSNAVCSPAIEFKSEGYVLGVGTKMFAVAGPVIVYSIVASAVYGLILCIIQLF